MPEVEGLDFAFDILVRSFTVAECSSVGGCSSSRAKDLLHQREQKSPARAVSVSMTVAACRGQVGSRLTNANATQQRNNKLAT